MTRISETALSALWKTAIHEAGHAVAHLRLLPAHYMGRVTVVPTDDYVGVCLTEEVWSEDHEALISEVKVLCAGYAACRIIGVPEAIARDGAGSDFRKAEEIIERSGLGPLNTHIATVTDLLRDEINWRAVERIARELVNRKTLDEDEVDVLLSVSDGDISEAEYERFQAHRGDRSP